MCRLSVISAGRRPPDPTRLLSSQRMHQLVAELTSCGAYDLVLFDTPPVLGLADAALVAEPPLMVRDGGFVAAGHDDGLDETRKLRDEGRTVIAGLQKDYILVR